MSFIKRLFSKKVEEDYETVLSRLAEEIQRRQLRLSELRLRERRSTLLVTLYTLAAWIAFVGVWYLDAMPNLHDYNVVRSLSIARALNGIPVVIGPIMILFIRRIVQIWYKKKGDTEEQIVKKLIKERRERVEDIKKKTNYYSTRELLQKYDDSNPIPGTSRNANALNPPNAARPPVTPQRLPKKQDLPAGPTSAGPAIPQMAATPSRRQWYDKLADAILGEDEAGIASPSTRYALICEKCFSHNGLVKESMWEDAQYVCPKCHHFNQSARNKRMKIRPSTPSISASPSTGSRNERRIPSDASSSSTSPPQANVDLPTVDSTELTPMDVDSSPQKERSSSP